MRSLKNILKKTISIILVFATVFTLAVGLSGCSSENRQVLITVEGTKVRKDVFDMYLFFVKYEYFYDYIDAGYIGMEDLAALDEDLLSTEVTTDDEGNVLTFADYLKYSAANACISSIVMAKYAKKNDIKLSSEDKDNIKSDKADFIESLGGAKYYDAFLDSINSSDNAYDYYMENLYLYSNIYAEFEEGGKYEFTDEELAEVDANYAASYVTVRHILFNTVNLDDESYPALSEEEIAVQYELAVQVLEMVKNGADFDEMETNYSANAGCGQFTFTDGEMDEAFSDAAFALRVGQVSELVLSQYGYHIIIRDELSDERYEDFYDAAVADKFSAVIQVQVDEASIKIKDAYDELAVQ